jgi:hypothetical protein
MKISDLENTLLKFLRQQGVNDFEVEQHPNGVLIKLQSPCEEIGFLHVFVTDKEVIARCKFTHTHISPHRMDLQGVDDPAMELMRQTAQMIVEVISDRRYFSK